MMVSNLICALLVTATAYNATVAQCGSSSGLTATGSKVRPGIIAVSRDLRHLLGKTVTLQGLGTYQVKDLMHRRHRRAVDIYLASQPAAKKFGRRQVRMVN